MEEFAKKDFAKIIKHNLLSGIRWMKATDSEAVRIYDRNLEDFPVTVELYGKYARVVDYSQAGLSEEDVEVTKDLIARHAYIQPENIILKGRKKMEGREQRTCDDGSLVVKVKEGGLVFECELMRYTDTGLFLDQANTRAAVREVSSDMRVLNLFAYTGSFSVYAAAGGAESVVSVDLSNVYSAWTERNLKANGFLDENKYRTVTADAKAFLEESARNGDKYDLVIFDPPSFSNSHKADDFDVRKDYRYFLSLISQLLVPGGVVVFSENLSGFEFSKNSLKPWWKIQEITEEMRAQGFSAKRNALRVWEMKKTADMYERAARKKDMDDERLELGEEAGVIEESAEKTEKSVGKRPERKEERRSGERGERRSDRDRGSRDRGRDRRDYGDRPRYSDRDRYNDRPRYSDRDSRPRYSDDRPRYSDRDRRDYGDRPRYSDRDRYNDRPRYSDRDRDSRPRYSDDRPRYSDRDRRDYGDRPRYSDRDRYNDRPRYSDRDRDSRPRYSDDRPRDSDRDRRGFDKPRDSYRQRDGFSGRRERGDWDNDTGRAYRADSDRRRNPPKPYGYDNFMSTKKRDKASTEWMKNTEIHKDTEKED